MYKVLGHSKCYYCKQAIQLLAQQGKSFEYLDAHEPVNQNLVDQIKEAGIQSVPQIWLNTELLGGFAELKTHLSE